MTKLYCVEVLSHGEMTKKVYFDNFSEAFDFRMETEKKKSTMATYMTEYNVQDGKSKIA